MTVSHQFYLFQRCLLGESKKTDVWAGLKTHPVCTPKLFEGGAAPSRNFIKTFAEGLTLISNARVCIKSVLKCVSVWLAPHPFRSWGARYAGAHLRSVLCAKWQKDESPNWASFVPVHCCKIWFQIRTSGQCSEWTVFIFCQHFNQHRTLQWSFNTKPQCPGRVAVVLQALARNSGICRLPDIR